MYKLWLNSPKKPHIPIKCFIPNVNW